MKMETITELSAAVEHYGARSGCRPGPVRAALIDMDGTLYDSMPWHARAWHRMVTELGIDANVDEFFAYEGMTGAATINLLFERAFGHHATDAEVKRLYGLKSKYFVENNHAVIMPGAQSMVRQFRDRGIETVLVTGSGQSTLLDRLDDDYAAAFRLRITSHDVSHGKPDPEPYLRAMEKAGVKPVESVVVENAPLGVVAGVRSGAFTIAVKTGPVPRAALVEAGADIVFDSMAECAETLSDLLYMLNT